MVMSIAAGLAVAVWTGLGTVARTTAPALPAASAVIGPAEATQTPVRIGEVPSTTGFNSLFIGHSFFQPVANRLAFHAANAGIVDHTQQTVFSGGATGAPQALWENAAKRAQIEGLLDTGEIDLFGMTYHPDYPSLEGYENWVAYALSRNPHTIIFVGFPWATYPGATDATAYGTSWHAAYDTIATGIIDGLRARFPSTRFFSIPYGHAAVDLYALYATGNLPDVRSFVAADGSGLFRDTFGHGGDILIDLAALVWLRAIYHVDLAAYAYDPGTATDLLAIAAAIMDAHDSTYNLPRWRRWTGIEPAGQGSPAPTALKAAVPTRRTDTSARGRYRRGIGSAA